MPFAEGTVVPIEKTRAEIEKLLAPDEAWILGRTNDPPEPDHGYDEMVPCLICGHDTLGDRLCPSCANPDPDQIKCIHACMR